MAPCGRALPAGGLITVAVLAPTRAASTRRCAAQASTQKVALEVAAFFVAALARGRARCGACLASAAASCASASLRCCVCAETCGDGTGAYEHTPSSWTNAELAPAGRDRGPSLPSAAASSPRSHPGLHTFWPTHPVPWLILLSPNTCHILRRSSCMCWRCGRRTQQQCAAARARSLADNKSAHTQNTIQVPCGCVRCIPMHVPHVMLAWHACLHACSMGARMRQWVATRARRSCPLPVSMHGRAMALHRRAKKVVVVIAPRTAAAPLPEVIHWRRRLSWRLVAAAHLKGPV